MRTIILRLAKKIILKSLREKRDWFIRFVNERIDLPKMDEEQEEKFLKRLYNVLYEALEEIL